MKSNLHFFLCPIVFLSFLAIHFNAINSRLGTAGVRMATLQSSNSGGSTVKGIRWAVLIAGSDGYYNYRHQADVCHAYQILKNGGLKDENIIVFMYDDIANNTENPNKGTIINHPNGTDVYKGVPKDYTGKDVNPENIYAAILGNKSAISGGSGKVVASGPYDHIFIYYSDHGGSGVLGMPSGTASIYAKDLVDVLKQKYKSKTYKNLVFYLEACESGSIFDGLLPKNMSIYATTAANSEESSFATYCPGDKHHAPPKGYETCLGDLYSVSWLENSEKVDRSKESLEYQYELVKNETIEDVEGSHVQQFGSIHLSKDPLAEFMGKVNIKLSKDPLARNTFEGSRKKSNKVTRSKRANQRDADVLHFWHKYLNSPEGSERKLLAQKELIDILAYRLHLDTSIEMIGQQLFSKQGNTGQHKRVMNGVRPAGQPLVDDWNCLKSMVNTFEKYCGSLSQYGLRHTRSMANMCNVGLDETHMAGAAAKACKTFPTNPWSALKKSKN